MNSMQSSEIQNKRPQFSEIFGKSIKTENFSTKTSKADQNAYWSDQFNEAGE